MLAISKWPYVGFLKMADNASEVKSLAAPRITDNVNSNARSAPKLAFCFTGQGIYTLTPPRHSTHFCLGVPLFLCEALFSIATDFSCGVPLFLLEHRCLIPCLATDPPANLYVDVMLQIRVLMACRIGSQWHKMAESLWVGDDTFRSTVKDACAHLPIDVEALFTEGQTIINRPNFHFRTLDPGVKVKHHLWWWVGRGARIYSPSPVSIMLDGAHT